MTPQVKTLLTHLQEHGSISQAEANVVYKIRCLPTRVFELKALGYKISKELKKDPTGQRYARYSLVKPTVIPKVGDRVRVILADETFNTYNLGDVGTVTEVDTEDEMLYVDFDHKPIIPPFLWFKEVEVIA